MFILVTTETANYLKPPETICNQPETVRNHPETARNHPKPLETTCNQSKNPPKLAIINPSSLGPPPHHRATSHQFLPCFSAVDLEHGFLIRKVKLGNHTENVAMIVTKSTLLLNSYAFSVIWQRLSKISCPQDSRKWGIARCLTMKFVVFCRRM